CKDHRQHPAEHDQIHAKVENHRGTELEAIVEDQPLVIQKGAVDPQAGQSACEGEEKPKAGEKYRLDAQSLARLGDVMCERIDTERHRGYQPTDKATSWTVMAAEQDVERGNKHEPKED